MATTRSYGPRFLSESIRRKLEVTSAMAWEALVDAHVEQANQFIALVSEYEPVEESLPRYLRELDLRETMATAIRTRVLTTLEEHVDEPDPDNVFPQNPDDGAGERWSSLLRQPQRVVKGVLRRQRRGEELERIVLLAIARAEENIIRTHVENAIGYVALLDDHLPLDRAVQQYLVAVALSGSRAQTVFQRTMARLADVHLPLA